MASTNTPLPRGTRQGTGWPPARNGVDMALAGEAMAVGDHRIQRDFGREGSLVPTSTGG